MNCFKTITVALTLLSIASSAKASLIDLGVDLGVADKYTIGVGQWDFHGTAVDGSLVLGSEAYIHGNVAASKDIGFAAGSIVYGDACSNNFIVGAGSQVTGTASACADVQKVGNNTLDQLSIDIASASQTARDLAAIDKGTINSSTTFDASQLNVINVSSITLGSSDILQINGNSNDNLIINILGNAQIASGAQILLSNGLTSANVLFNFVNDNFSSLNFGGANISGTFLATKGAFNAGDGAILDDVRFYTNHALIGNFQTVKTATPTSKVKVPEPSTILIILAALFIMIMRSNIKHQ
ncbi:choice-of-anchor A family protein [Thalassotalea sediminis]|uniref:choice-of-anchor A family protein n=1 Tax=Thalassotalea sediminis TaxID=1759089 RepID=UPI002574579A|nr:choice-of-anchor A family protein [Thalassotalea sediminis]